MPVSPTTVAKYGLTVLPADRVKTKAATSTPSTVKINEIPIPSTPLATRINEYVKRELDADTYRHCLRVYSYGVAIARECFPDWNLGVGEEGRVLDETWFVCAMLHDLGTTETNLTATRLSYEFWAGVKALEVLQDSTTTSTSSSGEKDTAAADTEAPKDQAESIAEAIFRHQDVQPHGNITLLTRLIHLGTLLDNIGAGGELVNKGTIEEVNGKYGREGWSGCFREVVEKEKREKGYAMVSRIEGFEGLIGGNKTTDI